MKLKINFTLKTGVQGEIPVLAILNFGYKEFDVAKQIYVYKPLRYYTGIKVTKENWDALQKLPKDKRERSNLIQLEKQIIDIFNYLKAHETITNERLKSELDLKLKGKDEKRIVTRVRLVDFITNDIAKDPHYKAGTVNAYVSFGNRLEEFEKLLGKPLYSHEVNEDIYNRFLDMMRGRERSTRLNGLWNAYKMFKAILNRISRKYKVEVFNPTRSLGPSNKLRSVNEEKIYFEFSQIQQIIKYKPETKELENAKLILLTLLFTGCRYSDVFKIKPEFSYSKNGISFNYARYFTEKTDTEIVVPILKPLQQAIDRNGGKTAYPIPLQKFNDLIRIIAEECEFIEDITLSYTDVNGKKQFTTQKQFKFVTSHIGRRSFVTNLINFIPIPVLGKITGHTTGANMPDFDMTESSIIFKYNKISLLDNAARFVKELKRQIRDNRDYFPFDLV